MPRIDQLSAHPKTTASPLTTTAQLVLRDSALSTLNTRNVPLSDVRDGRLFVTDYGAKGDNSADDTASIQAALDACPAGGHVFFPTGKYKTTAKLTCATQGIRLTGHGGPSINDGAYVGSCILPATSGMLALSFNSGGAILHQGPVIENLNFIDNTPGSPGTATLMSFYNVNHFTLRNCCFRPKDLSANHVGGTGIYLTRSYDGNGDGAWNYISQCSFNQLNPHIDNEGSSFAMFGGNCNNFGSTMGNVRLRQHAGGCVFNGVKFDQGSYGIWINGCSWNYITNCSFESNQTAILVDGTGSAQATYNNMITSNFIYGTSAGINLTDSNVIGTMLIGNVFNGMLNGGDYRVFNSGQETVRIDQNMITSATYSITNASATSVMNVSGVTVSGVANVVAQLITDLKHTGLVR